MKAKFLFRIKNGFVVDQTSLKKIYDLLTDRIGKTTVKADCADDVTREFENTLKLGEYENQKASRIVSLELRAMSDDFSRNGCVEFRDCSFFGGITISIQARDDVASRLRTDLVKVFNGMKPWFSALYCVNIWFSAIALYATFCFGSSVFLAFASPTEPVNLNSQQTEYLRLVAIGLVSAWFGIAYMLHSFRGAIFPLGSFKLGQGVERYETLEKFRWCVVVGFIISFLAGITQFVVTLPFLK